MPYVRQLVAEKANIINHNKKIYGTFAEIGAGQEVVNYFFKAGLASQTVAKSMSAYDMVFSDHIYGKSTRYVCEERLVQMLHHEYTLLKDRLQTTKGKDHCFFAFANTVSASTVTKGKVASHHGWMGLRFQKKPKQKYNEILLHVNLKDRTRLQQYEVLGALGVNLIYTAFYKKKVPSVWIPSLVDNFEKNRIEIDILKCSGTEFQNQNATLLNLELLRQDLTSMIVYCPRIQTPTDAFYDQTVILHSEKSLSQSKRTLRQASSLIQSKLSFKTPVLSFQVENFKKQKNKINVSSHWLIHKSQYEYELVKTIRQHTHKEIIFHLSIEELNKMLRSPSKQLSLLETLGKWFDKKTKIFISLPKDQLLAQINDKPLGSYLLNKNHIISL